MDRNLIDQTHAWEQTLVKMQRDIADLRARVGSPAIVTDSAASLDPGGSGAPLGSDFTLLSVGAQPGKWMIFTSVTLGLSNPDAGTTWVTRCVLSSRADGVPFTQGSDVLPAAQFQQGVASAVVLHTLTGFGWCAVDPTEYPDGFTIAFNLGVPFAPAWPTTVADARIALLPF